MYIYFFSIGYGLSFAGLSAAMLIMFRNSLLPVYREYVRTTPILLPFVSLQLYVAERGTVT